MKLKHETYDRVAVLTLHGEVTSDDVEPIEKLVEEQLGGETRDFVLDLSETEFLDSKALETLLWVQEQAGERLGQVRLASPTPVIRKILEITRLEHDFDTHEDVESALKSLR